MSSSIISIISSDHGRLRRQQRDISKRDLNAAVKSGTRSRCWGKRWMIEHEDITFILDPNMRSEVTAYPSPLKQLPVSMEDLQAHKDAKYLLNAKPELCASHTVLLVDRSGSMNTKDIYLHRDRHTAAYHNLAVEFVGEQILNGTANNSDAVSLIEFNEHGSLVFDREPCTWRLYNMLLSRRSTQDYVIREFERSSDLIDSNYIPALEKAKAQLEKGFNDSCALSLFFISDGAPTDSRAFELVPSEAEKRIVAKVKEIADHFGSNLNATFVGFGSQQSQFQVMTKMADAVNASESGAKAEFFYCENTSFALGQAMSSLVTSTLVTRTMITEKRFSKRAYEKEDGNSTRDGWRIFRIADHQVYDPQLKEWIRHLGLPAGSVQNGVHEKEASRLRYLPPYLAMSTKCFGEPGAERIAYRCCLCTSEDISTSLLGSMVAKESILVERSREQENFHREFFESQTLAATLAEEFNKRVQSLAFRFEERSIRFLDCSILHLEDKEWPGGVRGVLVEKQLDNTGWTKWTDNAGGVDGVRFHASINVALEMQQIGQSVGDIILEEEDEDEDEDSNDDDGSQETNSVDSEEAFSSHSSFLQAFSHFTYRYTNKKVMVCDLQGVFDEATSTFELTDPAIHYRSNRSRNRRFGNTDYGQAGVDKFFATHKCSKLCKTLRLTAKNSEWRKKWHGKVRLSQEQQFWAYRPEKRSREQMP